VPTTAAMTPPGGVRIMPAPEPVAASPVDKTDELDVMVGTDEDSVDRLLDPGTRTLLQQRQATRAATHHELTMNILRSQDKQRVDYAKRHHGPDPGDVMPPNSYVLMWVPPQNKLAKVAACEGPYLLVKYIAGSQALIEDSKGQRWPVAVSRLAPYRPQP
jgi:hypothetical protein